MGDQEWPLLHWSVILLLLSRFLFLTKDSVIYCCFSYQLLLFAIVAIKSKIRLFWILNMFVTFVSFLGFCEICSSYISFNCSSSTLHQENMFCFIYIYKTPHHESIRVPSSRALSNVTYTPVIHDLFCLSSSPKEALRVQWSALLWKTFFKGAFSYVFISKVCIFNFLFKINTLNAMNSFLIGFKWTGIFISNQIGQHNISFT